MPSKHAFLVLAPESHGSHLVTDLLLHAGCHGGSDHVAWLPDEHALGPEHDKPWDSELPTDVQPWDIRPPTDEDPIVWRRSVPHLGGWLDIKAMVSGLNGAGYVVRAIIVTRDTHSAIQSQLKWHHARSVDEAQRNIRKAYSEIFTQLAACDTSFVVTSYEALTRHPAAREQLVAELGLSLPGGFEVWDGNEKWHGEPADPPGTDPAPVIENVDEPVVNTSFPEAWFAAPHVLAQEYYKRRRLGRERMAQSRVVFCGLARDVASALPSALARIAIAGEAFADHRIVVYENDSTDGTLPLLEQHRADNPRLELISEVLNKPSWGSTRDPARMDHMAACRNRVLEHALQHHGDFDFLIALDLDLPLGFSNDGLAHCFGYSGWDWMGANGITAPLFAGAAAESFFYDAWAFRWPGDNQARPFEEINQLRFAPGKAPVSVWSCFGGLAIYRMSALHSGARYSGGECEHVAFHRELREKGHPHGYLNPNLVVLYSDQRP